MCSSPRQATYDLSSMSFDSGFPHPYQEINMAYNRYVKNVKEFIQQFIQQLFWNYNKFLKLSLSSDELLIEESLDHVRDHRFKDLAKKYREQQYVHDQCICSLDQTRTTIEYYRWIIQYEYEMYDVEKLKSTYDSMIQNLEIIESNYKKVQYERQQTCQFIMLLILNFLIVNRRNIFRNE